MNTQQAVVIVFMTGLLLVLIAVGFTAFEEQLLPIINIHI